ncbi:MAG: hypothetical protein OEV44_00785 [Spirochaetota bacterium]|nr:hypothetical protein [Spirochaetota bacterium]
MTKHYNNNINIKGLRQDNSIIMNLEDVKKELNKKYSEKSLIRQRYNKKQEEINVLLGEEEKLIKEEKQRNNI